MNPNVHSLFSQNGPAQTEVVDIGLYFKLFVLEVLSVIDSDRLQLYATHVQGLLLNMVLQSHGSG